MMRCSTDADARPVASSSRQYHEIITIIAFDKIKMPDAALWPKRLENAARASSTRLNTLRIAAFYYIFIYSALPPERALPILIWHAAAR